MKRRMIAATAALFLLLGYPGGPAGAKVLLEKHFDAPLGAKEGGELVETDHGQGWRAGIDGEDRGKNFQVFPVSTALRPKAGSIEMELVRGNETDEETLFSLVSAKGRSIFRANLHWEGRSQDGPELVFRGGRNLWYRTVTSEDKKGERVKVKLKDIPLPGKIPVGRSFHLVFTWGPRASDCNIYFDGQKLDTEADSPFGLAGRIEKASWLVIGAEVFKKWGTAENHLNSVLEYVRTFDTPENGNDLYTAAGRFSPLTGGAAGTVTAIDHDADRVAGFSGKLVAGDMVTVSLEGTAGAEATFDVARLSDSKGEIALDWKGWGVYLDEDKRFFDDDEVDLRDVEEYRVYVSDTPIGPVTLETEYVETLETGEQSYLVEALDFEAPYYVAVMALMDDDTFRKVVWPEQNLPMTEVEGEPGTYTGTFTVDYSQRYPEAVIVGRIGGDRATALVDAATFAIDPSLKIEVSTSPKELKADEKSTSKVKVTVTDANGDPVSGHEVRFVLATTSQYTGVVGGGNFLDEVGGSLSRDFWGETDLFGQMKATYTAGFAAKTAIIVARDMHSNDTGAGWVKTYINAAAELELEAVQEVAGKALGYSITVTSSDDWLTADGESEARITALVTQNGIPVEGHRVSFHVTSGTGRIQTVKKITGDDGEARAIYTAGTRIGTVLITAKDHDAGISGTVQIELRSDAPAKIAITVDPEILPADGSSRAEVAVLVTDINDNPNEGVEVEYVVNIGTGKLRNIEEVTDRHGESTAEYVAGRVPGKVSIKVTVRSTVPTAEEMRAARDLALAVLDYDFY